MKSSDSLFRLILGGLTKVPDVDGTGGGGTTTSLFTENPLNIITAVDVPWVAFFHGISLAFQLYSSCSAPNGCVSGNPEGLKKWGVNSLHGEKKPICLSHLFWLLNIAIVFIENFPSLQHLCGKHLSAHWSLWLCAMIVELKIPEEHLSIVNFV